jgi:hypothetical protein
MADDGYGDPTDDGYGQEQRPTMSDIPQPAIPARAP